MFTGFLKIPLPRIKNSKFSHERGVESEVKPIQLMSYLITMGSRKHDVVLDPFCGSGTTCMAAHLLERRWVGIEMEEEYVKIASARLRKLDSPEA